MKNARESSYLSSLPSMGIQSYGSFVPETKAGELHDLNRITSLVKARDEWEDKAHHELFWHAKEMKQGQ